MIKISWCLAFVLIVGFASPVLADMECKSVARLAGQFMEIRQQGHPVEVILTQIEQGNYSDQDKQQLVVLAQGAYFIPLATSVTEREEEIRKYEEVMLQVCEAKTKYEAQQEVEQKRQDKSLENQRQRVPKKVQPTDLQDSIWKTRV
jgi:hypothetical protein